MERSCTFLAMLALFLFFLKCSFAVLEVKETNSSNGLESKSSLQLDAKNSPTTKPNVTESVLDPVKDEKVKKGEYQDQVSQGEVKIDPLKGNSSIQLNTKEVPASGTEKHNPLKDSSGNEGDKKKSNNTSESNPVSKDGTREEVLLPSMPLRKENSRGEECDSSNKCSVKDKFIACLRVPGNESPDLLLLIQNKGQSSIIVKISVPDFVTLEKTTIQLQNKEDKKVKVSVGTGGTDDSVMVLRAGDDRCSLDFRDLLGHSIKGRDYNPKSSYIINILKHRRSVAYMSFLAILMMVASWMCFRLCWGRLTSGGSRYQKLETELPISGGGKTQSEEINGWDSSWGDSWDDEEAPMTPSKPVTPSLSSKGLASRRFNKEAWKD